MTKVVPWFDQSGFARFYFGLGETVENSLHEVVISGRALGVDHFLSFVIEGDKISKRAADIDGNDVRHKNPRSMFKVQGSK
jgi:hypothetical protein